MSWHEAKVVGKVDRIYVSSEGLKKKFRYRGDDVVYLPNACEISSLPHTSERLQKPVGRIVLGYVGTIGAWFDWRLIEEIAFALPEVDIQLVGPCFSRPPTSLPDNVRLHGPCQVADVPTYLQVFSAAMIPFKKSPVTACVDPIKYYEYRAMGLPILSTKFGDMARRGRQDGVFFLDNGKKFDAVLSEALDWHPRTEEILRFRQQNDWNSRFCRAGLF